MTIRPRWMSNAYVPLLAWWAARSPILLSFGSFLDWKRRMEQFFFSMHRIRMWLQAFTHSLVLNLYLFFLQILQNLPDLKKDSLRESSGAQKLSLFLVFHSYIAHFRVESKEDWLRGRSFRFEGMHLLCFYCSHPRGFLFLSMRAGSGYGIILNQFPWFPFWGGHLRGIRGISGQSSLWRPWQVKWTKPTANSPFCYQSSSILGILRVSTSLNSDFLTSLF